MNQNIRSATLENLIYEKMLNPFNFLKTTKSGRKIDRGLLRRWAKQHGHCGKLPERFYALAVAQVEHLLELGD